MNKNLVAVPVLLFGAALLAQAQVQAPASPTAASAKPAGSGAMPSRVAIINVQQAILGTADGKKATADLTAKFTPRRSVLEKQQADIQTQNDQLRKGAATLSEEAKAKLTKDIENNQKRLQRDGEDFEADVQQEENRIMNDLGQKMMELVTKYCQQNGIGIVINVADAQTPVLWADPAVDITNDILRLYDQAYPPKVETARPAAPAGAKPPVTPPAQKKQ